MRLPGLRDLPTLLVIAGFGVGFLLLGPSTLGGPATYAAVSGVSMEPTLSQGDLAVVRRAPPYDRGDIVVFRIPDGEAGAGAFVIHRIVGGSATSGFLMQGDNKRHPDPWRPTEDDIVGSVWFSVPGGGTVLARLREPGIFGAAAAGFVVFAVMLGSGGPSKRPEASREPADPFAPYVWTLERGLAVCGIDRRPRPSRWWRR